MVFHPKNLISIKIEPLQKSQLSNQCKHLEINKKTTPEMGVVCFGTARLANSEPVILKKLMICIV